jgi:glutamate racemase
LNVYIGPTFAGADKPDTIILGCTHFPLLRDVIADVAGPGVTLIDCGDAAQNHIASRHTIRDQGQPDMRFPCHRLGRTFHADGRTVSGDFRKQYPGGAYRFD